MIKFYCKTIIQLHSFIKIEYVNCIDNRGNQKKIFLHVVQGKKNEIFHFVKYFGIIAFTNYIFIQQNTCKILYINS